MFSIYVKTLFFLPVWTIKNTQYKCSNNTTITTTITFSNNQLILKDVYDIVYGQYHLDCDLNILCTGCENFYNNGYYYPTTELPGMLFC